MPRQNISRLWPQTTYRAIFLVFHTNYLSIQTRASNIVRSLMNKLHCSLASIILGPEWRLFNVAVQYHREKQLCVPP